MTGHWIIAPIVLPAVLAALALLAARDRLALARCFGLMGTASLLALALWALATSQGPQAYALGNWPAPFGIVLLLDPLAALMLTLAAALALPVLIHAIATGADRQGAHFHALWLLQLMGLNGAFLTGDAFTLFVFFEVLLIASYGLMVHGGGAARSRAGLAYIAVNLLGSTLFLFALGTLYAVTGTLNLADLAQKLPALPPGDQALLRVAATLLLVVFALKSALVPLHLWLPATYANAPGAVAALFAILTKVGAYAMLRFGSLVFPPGLPATEGLFATLLLPAALLTLALAALGALAARSLPLAAAFATLASMGTAFTALSLFTPPAVAAALYYLAHSTFAAALLFLVADLVSARDPQSRLPGPLAALYLTAAVALTGLPPLSGFLGKLFVLQATAAQAALIWPAILGASFLLLLALSRLGSDLFWKPQGPPAPPLRWSQAAGPLALAVLLAGLTLAAAPIHRHMAAIAAGLADPAATIAAVSPQALP